MDERTIYHRYKASRWALAMGTLLLGGWFNYDLIAKRIIRWDFVIILSVMLVAKLVARFYYHRTN